MNNLYKKIYEAVNTGIQRALILDQDVSMNYQFTDIAKHAKHEQNKLQQIAIWSDIDMLKAFAYELHVNDIVVFPSIADKFILKTIDENNENFNKNNIYEGLPYLKLNATNISLLTDLSQCFINAGWHTIDLSNNTNVPDKCKECMLLLEKIYTSNFIYNNLLGLYISPDSNVIGIIYKKSSELFSYNVNIIMGPVISDDFIKNYNVKINNSDLLIKTLKQLKLNNIINKCGFMPLYNEKHELYFETYLISDNKQQYELYHKLYDSIMKSKLDVINGNYDITGEEDVAFFMPLTDNKTLWIKQFTEPYDTNRKKYGWRVFISE